MFSRLLKIVHTINMYVCTYVYAKIVNRLPHGLPTRDYLCNCAQIFMLKIYL